MELVHRKRRHLEHVIRTCGWLVVTWSVLQFSAVSCSAEPAQFQVQTDVILKEATPQFCWFHPRVAALPGYGIGGQPAAVLTIQKHLAADDHYSGLYYLRSNDGGKSWTKPVLPQELDWQKEPPNVTLAVCDATPGWHPQTRKLLVIGIRLRYSQAGAQLLDLPGSHSCAYAIYDPQVDKWTTWKTIVLPDSMTKFFLASPGCVQWLVREDGSLLIPMYYRGPTREDYSTTVLHCEFDGTTVTYLKHGTELQRQGGRGYVEPSLAKSGEKYYLTLRNDARGYVATSTDGLQFGEPQPWTFDDGSELGSYNTQTHWLTHGDELFLSYTRRGAQNDHIARHRAPLFLARVDRERLCVIRATEQVLIPERGVMLGNFGAAPFSPQESWVTDSEYLLTGKPDERGADGSTFLARVKWSAANPSIPDQRPLKIITLGDSITKGYRPGVSFDETFSSYVEEKLLAGGAKVIVVNKGIGGERTDQAAARLERDILAEKPDIVTIMYGANDSYIDKGKEQPRLSAEQFSQFSRQLVERLQQQNIAVILMTENSYGPKPTPNGIGENPDRLLAEYCQRTRDLATELKLPLVDHYRHWIDAGKSGTDVGTWTTDQLHPNPKGHQIMAEVLFPVLQDVVRQREQARKAGSKAN